MDWNLLYHNATACNDETNPPIPSIDALVERFPKSEYGYIKEVDYTGAIISIKHIYPPMHGNVKIPDTEVPF
jgi:hypothetical protein